MATLSYGSKGSEVTNLQKLLNSNGYSLKVDGVFGDKTLSAVKDFQTKTGLVVDGIVGANTLATLDGSNIVDSEVTADEVNKLYNDLTGNKDGTTGETTESTTETTKEKVPGDTSRVEAAMDALKNNETLSQLIADLNKDTYTPLTAEQIKEQAEREYQSYYDTLRQSAQQKAETQDLALQQQKEGLAQTYDMQREKSAKQYRQAYSQADRETLARGMQRSSYAGQTLTNISLEAAEAQQELYNAQASAENQISTQQTLLAAQLADQLSQYDANEAADILTRMDELEAREYDRSTTAANNKNSLTLQIYSILNEQLKQQVEHEQWLAEFNESVRQFDKQFGMSGGGSGGGGGYSGGYSSGYSSGKKSYGSSSKKSSSSSSLYDDIMSASSSGSLKPGKLSDAQSTDIANRVGASLNTLKSALAKNVLDESSGSWKYNM